MSSSISGIRCLASNSRPTFFLSLDMVQPSGLLKLDDNRHALIDVVSSLDPGGPGKEAVQPRCREELGVGNRAAQRDEVRIGSVLEEFWDDTGDGDRRGSPW